MDVLKTLEEIYNDHKRIDVESPNKYDNLAEMYGYAKRQVQSLQFELEAARADVRYFKERCLYTEKLEKENESLREFFYAYMEFIGEHLPGCDGGDGDCKCKINKLSEGR